MSVLLLAGFVVGHWALLIWIVNVAHGSGVDGRWVEPLTLGLLVGLGGLAIPAAWWLWGRGWWDWPPWLRAYSVPCLAIGLVGLPISSAMIRLRRRPSGIAGVVRPLAIDVGTLRLPRGLLGLPGNGSLRPELAEWRVEVPGLPTPMEGLSILHLSDLHFSPRYDPSFFRQALAAATAAGTPDLVLFTGDLVDHDDALAWIAPILGAVPSRLGNYAILGNHDRRHGPARVTAQLTAAGFEVVEGRWATLAVGDSTISIGGTSAPWGAHLDLDARPRADLSILLSHTPDLFPAASRSGIDLVLSGHNHGGQIRLPLLGPLLTPSRYSRRYAEGFFRRGRTLLFVNRGLAAKHPIRYGCPPEVARLVVAVGDRLT